VPSWCTSPGPVTVAPIVTAVSLDLHDSSLAQINKLLARPTIWTWNHYLAENVVLADASPGLLFPIAGQAVLRRPADLPKTDRHVRSMRYQ